MAFIICCTPLLYEADLILTEAEAQTPFATKRLKDNLLTSARELLVSLGGKGSSVQAQTAATGKLTKQQNTAVVDLLDWFGKLKDSAKQAFHDHPKLRDEFQVGINSPNDLASVLGRAQKAMDAANDPANATALKDAGGWIAEDVAKLKGLIETVGEIDKAQQKSFQVGLAGTDARNTAANTLSANLETIQNAANLEWPEGGDASRGQRAAFRPDWQFPSRAREHEARCGRWLERFRDGDDRRDRSGEGLELARPRRESRAVPIPAPF